MNTAPKNLKTLLIKKLGISASQFHSVVKSLELPIKDAYTNDEVERIVAYVQAPVGQPEQPNHQPSQAQQSQYQQHADRTQATADNALTLLSRGSSQSLSNLKNHVGRVMQKREATVEQVSETLAALHDPDLMEQEILARTAHKIATRQQERKSAFDALEVPAWDLDIDLPTLPSLPTAMGQLPA